MCAPRRLAWVAFSTVYTVVIGLQRRRRPPYRTETGARSAIHFSCTEYGVLQSDLNQCQRFVISCNFGPCLFHHVARLVQCGSALKGVRLFALKYTCIEVTPGPRIFRHRVAFVALFFDILQHIRKTTVNFFHKAAGDLDPLTQCGCSGIQQPSLPLRDAIAFPCIANKDRDLLQHRHAGPPVPRMFRHQQAPPC